MLESAKAFKRWVTKDVLTSIRKTGRYDYCINHKYNNTLTFKIENEMDLHVMSFLSLRRDTLTIFSMLHKVKTKILSIKELIPLRRDAFVALQT